MNNNLDLYRFFVGWCRYSGGFSTPWIACAIYSGGSADAEEMADAFYNLDAGDTEASDALEFIKKNADIHVFSSSPSEAIKMVEQQVLQRLS